VVAALARAAGDLARTTKDPFSAGDAVVSVVRDLQQAVAVAGRAPADAASLSARADVQSVSGRRTRPWSRWWPPARCGRSREKGPGVGPPSHARSISATSNASSSACWVFSRGSHAVS
jgi:hypothetical protein